MFFTPCYYKKEQKELSKGSKAHCKRRSDKSKEKYSLFEEFQTTPAEEEEKALDDKNTFRSMMRKDHFNLFKEIRFLFPDPVVRKLFYKYFKLTGCPKDPAYFLDFISVRVRRNLK